MSRKKVNPNRVPIGPGDYDLEQIKDQATSSIVLQEWAVILATLSNLEGMSTEKLLDSGGRWIRCPPAVLWNTSRSGGR